MKDFSVNMLLIRWVIGAAIAIVGIIMFGQSLLLFLKTGEWTFVSVLDAIRYLLETPDGKVAIFFSEWLGLAKMLQAIPAFIVPLGVAFLVSLPE